MDIILHFTDFFIHLDKYLPGIIDSWGILAYLIVFTVILYETGLVGTPHIEASLILLCIAAIAGSSVNSAIKHYIGPKVAHYKNGRFLKQALCPFQLLDYNCKRSPFIKLKQASVSVLRTAEYRFVYKIIFCCNSPERITECTIL